MKKIFIIILMLIYFSPLESFGDECVEGDCINGKGTMVFSTGHKYTGEFKDGNRHGKGVMLMPQDGKIEIKVLKGAQVADGAYDQCLEKVVMSHLQGQAFNADPIN